MAPTRRPSDIEPSEEANRITDRLLDSLVIGVEDYSSFGIDPALRRRHLEFEPISASVPIADIEASVSRLRTFLRWSRSNRLSVVCLMDGEGGSPILPNLWDAFETTFQASDFHSFYEDAINSIFSGLRVVPAAASDIPHLIEKNLRDYVSVRVHAAQSSFEYRSLGAASNTHANNPYLPFEVRTQSTGLRIHYTKSFLLTYDEVFGAPSSPVAGWILPGIHRFAGVDPSGQMHFDRGKFTTPPMNVADLTI